MNKGNFGKHPIARARKIAVAFSFLIIAAIYPCTTFCFNDANGERIFGKSFDWSDAHGVAFINKRHVQKTAMVLKGETPLTWVSKYGSISFNQHGREFPLGGMNEQGLAIEIMLGPVQDIPNGAGWKSVNEVQIIQYMLDSFASVGELPAGLENVRVARVASDTHYMVCDKFADCSSVEFLGGKLVLHQAANLPYKAFTNSSYDESASAAAQYQGLGGDQALPSDGSSDSRFARAAAFAKNSAGSNDPINEAQAFIDQVTLSGRWRIVYKGTTEVAFRADPHLDQLKDVNLRNFDFACTTPVKAYGLDKSASGDVTASFTDYTSQQNDLLVDQNFMLPFALRTMLKNYPATTKCTD